LKYEESSYIIHPMPDDEQKQVLSEVKAKEKIMNAVTFTFQAVTYNGVKGYFATRRINGVYAGKQFGRTQKAAKAAFEA
jgi:hypothetical protein